jgi:hypothetical protein
VVQERLGHSNPAFTLALCYPVLPRIYGPVSQSLSKIETSETEEDPEDPDGGVSQGCPKELPSVKDR